MNTIATADFATEKLQLVIKQALKAWENQHKSVTTFFNQFADDFYQQPVAPGRNRAIYLLGHLTAMNDLLLPMLDLGKQEFPELEPLFVTSPDQPGTATPTIAALRTKWEQVNRVLAEKFAQLKDDEWFQRHTKVSEADFALDPSRNKLNVLLSRTNHMGYHYGQLVLLRPRK